MLKRSIQLPSKQSFFLFGARQTGKSTLIKSRFKDAWTINFLNMDELFRYFRDLSLFRQQARKKIESGIRQIVIDEVQRAPQILNEVQSLMLEYKQVQFILTGSSARKLKRGGANLLAGRATVNYLFPFIYDELPKVSLDEILHWGTLPALLDKTEAEKRDILNTYSQVYLQEEIKSEGIARNLSGFTRFLDLAASQSSELVSFSSIARECRLPVRSVSSYYEILEDTMIGYRLLAWDKSLRKRIVAHPKFYLFDLGITNALNRRLAGELDRQTKGRLFEQFVILETVRNLHYQKSESRLYFWRTNHGADVDLLIERHNKVKYAIEIKYSEHISSADLSGLRAFQEEYPKTKCWVVCLTKNPYEINGIQIIGWQQYIKEITHFLI